MHEDLGASSSTRNIISGISSHPDAVLGEHAKVGQRHLEVESLEGSVLLPFPVRGHYPNGREDDGVVAFARGQRSKSFEFVWRRLLLLLLLLLLNR